MSFPFLSDGRAKNLMVLDRNAAGLSKPFARFSRFRKIFTASTQQGESSNSCVRVSLIWQRTRLSKRNPLSCDLGEPRMVTEAANRDSQLILLIDDDLMVTEGLAAGLEREGRTIITCNDVESAQLIVERLSPSHIVTDVRISGPFGFEGLDFIRHAKRHSPESRVILMTGDAPEALQLEASERGAVAFLRKPFGVEELESILNLMASSEL